VFFYMFKEYITFLEIELKEFMHFNLYLNSMDPVRVVSVR
jgi:hypothetical protein